MFSYVVPTYGCNKISVPHGLCSDGFFPDVSFLSTLDEGYLTRSYEIFPRGLTVTKSFTSILCASAGEISIGDPKYYIKLCDTLDCE